MDESADETAEREEGKTEKFSGLMKFCTDCPRFFTKFDCVFCINNLSELMKNAILCLINFILNFEGGMKTGRIRDKTGIEKRICRGGGKDKAGRILEYAENEKAGC